MFVLVSWKMLFIMNVHRGFLFLSHNCCLDIDCPILTVDCRTSLGDSVELLSRTSCTAMVVGDWCSILKHWCLRSDNIAASRYHNRPLREKFPPLILPTMLWARFVIHQSPTTMVVQIVLLRKLTLLPDSGNCETNDKWNPLYIEKPTMRKVWGWLAPSSRLSVCLVAKNKIQKKKIKFFFVKSQGIDIYYTKVLPKRFHLNCNTPKFHPLIKKLGLHTK